MKKTARLIRPYKRGTFTPHPNLLSFACPKESKQRKGPPKMKNFAVPSANAQAKRHHVPVAKFHTIFRIAILH